MMEKFGFHVGKTVQKGFGGALFSGNLDELPLGCERFGGPISWQSNPNPQQKLGNIKFSPFRLLHLFI